MTTAPAHSPWRAVWTVVAVLVAVVVVRTAFLPGGAHFWFHVAVIAVLVGVARRLQLSAVELGVERDALRHSFGAALWVLTAVGAVTALVVSLGDTAGVSDDRVDVGVGGMLVRALIVIPVGTVLMEELAFRGVLLAAARRATTTLRAVALSSVAFGLWHVVTAWNSSAGDSTAARVGAVVGSIAATTAFGAALCWLRLRWSSLLMPVAAHIGTNSVAFFVAWALAR